MMTATLDTTTSVRADSDRLTAIESQLDFIAAELRAQQQIREGAASLVHDLAPISSAVMDRLTVELAELDGAVTLEDLGQLARTMALNVNRINALMAQLESLSELAATLTHLAAPAMDLATGKLQELDDKGYFAFAQQATAIADHVVTSFSEDDVKALGDNVVLILETVKEMTQPEVMTMLRRTAVVAKASEESYDKPPSLVALVKQMRDPEVRRGLARALTLLRSLGTEAPTDFAPATTKE